MVDLGSAILCRWCCGKNEDCALRPRATLWRRALSPKRAQRPSSSFLILLSFSCFAATLWLHIFSFPLVKKLFLVLLFPIWESVLYPPVIPRLE